MSWYMRTQNSVFKWERQWVSPAGLPQGSGYKVLKWIKTSEKARFISLTTLNPANTNDTANNATTMTNNDNNAQEDAEDVDMEADADAGEGENENEHENEEQDDDDEVVLVRPAEASDTKPDAEIVDLDVDVSMDSQHDDSRPQSAAQMEEQPSPSAATAADDQPRAEEQAALMTEEITVDVQPVVPVAGDENDDKPSNQETAQGTHEEEPTMHQNVTETSQTSAAEPSVPLGAASPAQPPTEQITLLDDQPSPSPPFAVQSIPKPAADDKEQGAMEVDVDVGTQQQQQQQLDRPENSVGALALPVESAVPLPSDVAGSENAEHTETMKNADQSGERGLGAEGVDIMAAPNADTLTQHEKAQASTASSSLPVEYPPQPQSQSATPTPSHHADRSRTPSPTPARIQEFKQSTSSKANEPPILVPGNLPSPSPQPEPQSILHPQPRAEAPSNAVKGSVAGAHVADVQLGGGAAGTQVGEITLEASHYTTAQEEQVAGSAEAGEGGEMMMLTMEGEADPGVPLGEGDPVGVNGEEEFADVDIRRAGASAEAESETSTEEMGAHDAEE
ncbi:hypothetical protein QFC21_005091 [Naganishia friedmannii]|uniref:Uncharacterized protein n=1 Tax=Naganishia friedmannii TaxID=89922 RepID=A0ACC2VBS0_9TREE|nr:hypothetical protein QFC21_005091 [Naganishia friedmannii]